MSDDNTIGSLLVTDVQYLINSNRHPQMPLDYLVTRPSAPGFSEHMSINDVRQMWTHVVSCVVLVAPVKPRRRHLHFKVLVLRFHRNQALTNNRWASFCCLHYYYTVQAGVSDHPGQRNETLTSIFDPKVIRKIILRFLHWMSKCKRAIRGVEFRLVNYDTYMSN